jgi:hypothetical protein
MWMILALLLLGAAMIYDAEIKEWLEVKTPSEPVAEEPANQNGYEMDMDECIAAGWPTGCDRHLEADDGGIGDFNLN